MLLKTLLLGLTHQPTSDPYMFITTLTCVLRRQIRMGLGGYPDLVSMLATGSRYLWRSNSIARVRKSFNASIPGYLLGWLAWGLPK